MAHRSHTSPKADDYKLLELELSPNPLPPPPPSEEPEAPAPVVQEAPPQSSPPKPKASPLKLKGSPLKIKFPSPGKVKEMISKIERSRSHTLPTSPRSPRPKTTSPRFKAFKGEGVTALLETSPSKRLGLLRSYAVPVKGGGEGDTADSSGASENNFVGSMSLPDLEPSFFDQAMNNVTKTGGESTPTNLPTQNSSSNPILSSNDPATWKTESPAGADTPLSQRDLNEGIKCNDDVKNGVVQLSDVDVLDRACDNNTVPSSVRSVEGYINMAKPATITDSGGYVKMQPSLMPSYKPKSPTIISTSSVYAVGESSSNNSDMEQNVKDMRLLSPETTHSPRPSPEPASDNSGGRGSMENLFEEEFDEVEEDKHKPRKTIRRRIRKLFRRHKSAEAPTTKSSSKRGSNSSSPTSSISSSSTKKSRSLSNVELLKITVEEENERELSPPTPSKPRSASENDVLDEDASGYPVKRSYTMLTDHITRKYQKKILEKLRTDSGVSSGSGMSETPSTLSPVKESVQEEDDLEAIDGGLEGVDLTPLSKMTPQRYRRSLYCDQLKYKLRAALQNIHTPLSLSPIYLQLCVDDDAKCDSRYQLILLIQHALQRSRWRHEVMEIALLTELLKMIEPLPNEL